MIFSTLTINNIDPIYVQIEKHIMDGINKGELRKDSKLPSTREASKILNISRNSVIAAYEELESKGLIITKKGRGTFICAEGVKETFEYNVDWNKKTNNYSRTLLDLDIMKNELHYKKGMISFKSIAPSDELFNLDDFKRAFLDAWSNEEKNLLNYGYAKGYKPLIDYLFTYMEDKLIDTNNKDILITNGFTEAFDIVISSLTNEGDTIICEEPTHNTALKILKAHGVNAVQVPLDNEGMDLIELEKALINSKPKFGYIIPSYNNPTGIVTKTGRRKEILKLFRKYNVPIIEDGFNEELLYSSSPIDPLAAMSGEGNSIIYLGSLSKILSPGLRIGWILADKNLINILESVKRGRTIHCSFLDQSMFYYYLKSGALDRHIKNVRKYYRDKYKLVMEMVNEYIDYECVTGEGGLHIFIKLKNNINARELLKECYKEYVIFTPGDLFYSNGKGKDTFRIGFGRVSDEDIIKGIKIIGKKLKEKENGF
ncbi:MAG: PLP-dependent aminotransferase family protein [Clostridiales bacterium]|nr:PLP-dependent aminotransferase family protein [Clostridiales bacterium]